MKLNPKLHLNENQEPLPTRNGYGDALVELGKTTKNIYVLCADLSESTRVDTFAKLYPNQFVEIGVAEQNLVTVASGLAHAGKIPFASSYAAFCPGRCWEQIRTTICYNNQNVKIIGAHAGISVGPDGATHQMLEDLALMRALPNIIVIVPREYAQTKAATKALAKHIGPAYMRFAREKTPQLTTSKPPFKIGQAQVLKDGSDITIIGCGPLTLNALSAAKNLGKQGISVAVINCHTLKPFDTKTIETYAKKTKLIITIEEAQTTGGLGSAVAEHLSDSIPTKIHRLGIQDHFGESGEPEELLKKYHLTSNDIALECHKLFKTKNSS